ncbi:MAG TPA: Gfo/Idh/MocA family oxidoreductase [Phycisphaerae bacterium]|jgi:predicted dehydrogenase|nr:Gfo/Idh/MocA family oxidoreductase [Phycisphaerae bacterium]HOB76469.1 Gfo/Idh/MocA family oxidoreductase [Phycisphaerae bacterium]HOJ56522.1 Gfo/Idh/MocA family oxidoreductase [Phycisphaerae bacterium]HOL28320.1 Gfo/Idh/MocA family oxidoreductase [Phycisphaerae bacterium]HPP22710.1 Gfo/Idh/MocA family oxidoreductase [Phycisphaerae bacterium]
MSQRNHVTRRAFLHGAAATLAAPYIVPASALGRNGWKPPSERITLGFIGIGNMGGGHLHDVLRNESMRRQLQVVAVCDVDGVKRENARKAVEDAYAKERNSGVYKGCEEYHEFEKLLERKDIDAVLCAVPDHWHAIVAIAACRAGKDIYSEKPLTLTIREAQELTAAVRRYNRVFQTGSQQRSEWNFRFACELVRNGRIGKLQTVYVNIGEPSEERYFPEEPVRDRFDWDRWLGPAPWQPYNSERCSGSYSGGWRRVRDYSGGMTTDWGAHHFDIGQWGMGMDENGPVEILPLNREKNEPMTFIYANGVRMIRCQQAEGHGSVNGVLFVGTEGRVEVNRGYLKTWPESLVNERIGPGEIHLYESPGHKQDWINCIRNRKRPICDVAIGASSVIVCHLGNIAYWLQRPIKWDPARGEIVGDTEASRWLDRPRRAPWRLYL